MPKSEGIDRISKDVDEDLVGARDTQGRQGARSAFGVDFATVLPRAAAGLAVMDRSIVAL
jgi:hypothetical protein